ncbi:PepSY-associated TM helix domain-containing protein [Sphingobium phenoxybenzoativorans]|uniref:PepSY-associated TM helix domain-containing protein n=2 Tax=Sphingobium phenoxybenzoativorans TaxID=1592790 RepID=A0A975KAY3_9SPHN|nr:PepSY-associated TM helix domain-containing protein [Sphingobium phenoxybenzoativorans]
MKVAKQPAKQDGKAKKARKTFWLKQLHTWHWISSAISLIGLLLFAFTGITLNHAADIEGEPKVVEAAEKLPADLLKQIAPDNAPDSKKPLPAPVAAWVGKFVGRTATGEAEWSAAEVYLPLPRPGGDGWVSIDRETGDVSSEATDRGWISYLNDLHKGRNSGSAWKWFIDIFAVACFIFALTGLFLLWLHSAKRPSTWPLVALGLIIPAVIAVIFIH